MTSVSYTSDKSVASSGLFYIYCRLCGAVAGTQLSISFVNFIRCQCLFSFHVSHVTLFQIFRCFMLKDDWVILFYDILKRNLDIQCLHLKLQCSFTHLPTPMFASEMKGPLHTKIDTTFTFRLCWFIWGCKCRSKMADNYEQDPFCTNNLLPNNIMDKENVCTFINVFMGNI